MNKHYIRLNRESHIIHAFSSAFEQPLETDICVNEDGGRHYNPPIQDENGAPLRKYVDGEIIPTTDEERSVYIPKPEPTTEEIFNEMLLALYDKGVLY